MTKLEGRIGGGTTIFLYRYGCQQEKTYINSFTHVKMHICGVLEKDNNKDAIGISIFPRVS